MLTHKGTQPIETSRLILRRAVREDAEAMFRNWATDPEVTKYLTWPPHENVEVTQSLLERWSTEYEKDDYYHWMIVLKDIGQPIGSLLVTTVGRAQSAHIGYCIGRNWWHKGIMPEAVRAVIKFLFEEVGYHRIEAMHDPNNPNSGRVMRKCGMKYEGTTHASDRNNQGIWACNEITDFESRNKLYEWKMDCGWEAALTYMVNELTDYLTNGKYSELLKSSIGVGVGFVDGSIEILHSKSN